MVLSTNQELPQHDSHNVIAQRNRKQRHVYNRSELGRTEEGMEGIQDRKSPGRQRQDEGICDEDPQAPGRTGNQRCFIPALRHSISATVFSFILSRNVQESAIHRTRSTALVISEYVF